MPGKSPDLHLPERARYRSESCTVYTGPCVGCYGVGPIGRHPELFPFFRFGAPGSSYSPATALIKSNIYAISENLLVQPRLGWESCCLQEFRRRALRVMET
jgi:hypothetical protein